jgi:hypothetical protein
METMIGELNCTSNILYSMDQIDMGMTSRKQNLRKTVYNIFY